MTERGSTLYMENKLEIWALILIGIPSILFIGSLTAPQIFWESFLWRYLWGPVVADAYGHPVDGVSEGYNVVNTAVYGVTLVLAFLGIWELVEHFDLEIDTRFIYSLLPWILLGGSLRALEDGGFFSKQIAPFFISPVIYMALGLAAIAAMVAGAELKGVEGKMVNYGLRGVCLSIPLIIFLLFASRLYLILSSLLFLSLLFFYLIGVKKGWMDECYLLISYGVGLLLVSLSYNLLLILERSGTHPWELVVIPASAAAVAVIFAASLKLLDALRWRKADDVSPMYPVFFSSINILLIYSHLFDASATFRGIQGYGYAEKHVLPTAAIQLTGTAAVMFPLKLILIVLVIYVLDVMYEDELLGMPGMKNLLKAVVIILGLAPAVRNTLRLAIGV